MTAQGKFDGFTAFVISDRLSLEFTNFGTNSSCGGIALVGIGRCTNAEETRTAGGIVAGADGMDEALILLDFPVETRAAAFTGDNREHVECRHIRVGRGRHVPGEVEMRDLDRRVFVAFAKADLRRLDRDGGRRDGVHFEVLGQLAEARFNGGGINVADDDEDEIVRHVHTFVIADDVIAGDAVINIRIANDGMLVRMRDERGVPLQPVGAAAGIVNAHGHLAEDDLFFLEEFVGRDGGIHHAVGQNVHGRLPVF